MTRTRERLWQRLLIGLVVMAGWASAELQNVTFNGNYALKEEARIVRLFPVTLDDSGQMADHIRMVTSELGRSSSYAHVQKISIPAQLTPKSYPDMGRVFLSLYVGRPTSSPGDMDLAITIRSRQPVAAPYRIYTGVFTEPGWHPILIDLLPWAGQVVDLTFQAGWLDGDAHDVILGLPRLIASHGPSYDGSGGLSSGPYHHGRGSVQREAAWTIRVDGTLMEGGPLLITRFDAIKESTMRMRSSVQDYAAKLFPGIHWMALQLPTQPESKIIMGPTEGRVEQGPVDVIPNFMVNDKKGLADIIKTLDPALDIPLSPQLFRSSPVAVSEP